jgi:hypothetical protein
LGCIALEDSLMRVPEEGGFGLRIKLEGWNHPAARPIGKQAQLALAPAPWLSPLKSALSRDIGSLILCEVDCRLFPSVARTVPWGQIHESTSRPRRLPDLLRWWVLIPPEWVLPR